MSCNHLVRFWLQYIFYYLYFLFFSSLLCRVSMYVCVLVDLIFCSCLMGSCQCFVAFLSTSLWIATACDCWLLEQNKMNEWMNEKKCKNRENFCISKECVETAQRRHTSRCQFKTIPWMNNTLGEKELRASHSRTKVTRTALSGTGSRSDRPRPPLHRCRAPRRLIDNLHILPVLSNFWPADEALGCHIKSFQRNSPLRCCLEL